MSVVLIWRYDGYRYPFGFSDACIETIKIFLPDRL